MNKNSLMQQALHWLEYAEIEFAEARIAAEVIKEQIVQIAGLQADNEALKAARDMLGGYWEKEKARVEVAENKVTELEARLVNLWHAAAVVAHQVEDTGEFTKAAMKELKEALLATASSEKKEST